MRESVNHLKSWSTLQMLPLIGLPIGCLVLLLNAAGAAQVVEQQPASLPPVEVLRVASQTSYQREVRAVGRVEAGNIAHLGFENAGTIHSALVDEGQAVAAGQLLARLDTQRLDAQMRQAEATIAKVNADARLAALSTRRLTQLVASNLDSQQRLDEARETEAAAAAAVQEAIAAKARLEVELTKAQLYSPYAGTILSRPMDPGSVVMQAQTVFTMQKNNHSQVRIPLGREQAFDLQVGQSHTLHLHDSQQPVVAVVKSIAPARNLNTRTVDVVLQIQQNSVVNSANRVLPGDLLSLNLKQVVPESGMWVPTTALSGGVRGLWTVYTVASAASEGTATIVPKAVTVLYNSGTDSYVTGALQDGDQVVTQGVHRLVPGQVVAAVASNT